MFYLKEENKLSVYRPFAIEFGKAFFVSREITPREKISNTASCIEGKSTPSPDVYWKKSVYLPGNALDTVDFENRLIRRISGTKTINISYDADGNRVSKTVSDSISGTTTTYYLVDTNNLTGYAQVFEELYNNGGNLETYRSYTYGSDLIAQHQLMPPANPTQWETSFYMYDGLGTVRALTDANGLITDAYTYSAFGELLNVQSSGTATPNAYLYTGEQYDSDLGMYFLRARYLNPEKGRMHTMDPFEGFNKDPRTLHKYVYGNANPISFIDPSGNISISDLAAASFWIGVAARLAIPRIAPYVSKAAAVWTTRNVATVLLYLEVLFSSYDLSQAGITATNPNSSGGQITLAFGGGSCWDPSAWTWKPFCRTNRAINKRSG